MALKRTVQVTLRWMSGAEAWVRIEHNRGWFKVPHWVEIGEVFDLAEKRACNGSRRHRAGEPRVSIPLSEYLDLRERAADPR